MIKRQIKSKLYDDTFTVNMVKHAILKWINKDGVRSERLQHTEVVYLEIAITEL